MAQTDHMASLITVRETMKDEYITKKAALKHYHSLKPKTEAFKQYLKVKMISLSEELPWIYETYHDFCTMTMVKPEF